MKKTLALILVFFCSGAFFAFAEQKGDINSVSLENPTSVYFHNSPYFEARLNYLNSINVSNSKRVGHSFDLDTTFASSVFALRLKLGSQMRGDLAKSHDMDFDNSFDIKLGAGFGWWDFLSLGLAWNIGGTREKIVQSYESTISDYFRNLIILHNDAAVTSYDSNFSLYLTVADKNWIALSVFIDRFFSLNTQSISFSMSDISNSLGLSFMLKTQDYDTEDIPNTFVFSLFGTFGGILSPSPSMDMSAKIRFVIFRNFDISFVAAVEMADLRSDSMVDCSTQTLQLVFNIYGFNLTLSSMTPFAVYAGESKYFDLTVGIRYGF